MSKRGYSDAFANTDQRRTTEAISSTPSAFLQPPSESNYHDLTAQRESHNDASTHLARSGHTFGDLSFTGSAPIHLGDNVQVNLHANDVQQQDLRKVLYYESMNQRRANLESTTTAPMDWIWATEFGCWLRSEQPLFWISGKPGSGKSTLTKFLASSSETLCILKMNTTKKWLVLDFYFDFRSGSSTANSSLGLLRTLLFQLVNQCSEIDTFVRQRHNHALEGEWVNHESALRNTVCDVLKTLQQGVCAFVDGLDEYTGSAKALMDTLLAVQACTGIKLCLASRPENMISRVLSSYPGLKVQHYNSATIEAYIRSTSVQVLSREEISTLRPLWRSIEQAANGIMLWARFAADQLVEQCIAGATTSELMAVLDGFPVQLEDVYQRTLERLNNKQRFHASIAAHLLVIHGSMRTDCFFVYWCMIAEELDDNFCCDDSFDTKRFIARMYSLFGGLVEFIHSNHSYSPCLINDSGDVYNDYYEGYPGRCSPLCRVQFVHKTLLNYLTQSRILAHDQVTIDMELIYPTPTSLKFMIVQKANTSLHFDIMGTTNLVEEINRHVSTDVPDVDKLSRVEQYFRSKPLETHWRHRIHSFLDAISDLFDDTQAIAADMATWNVLSLPSVQLHGILCTYASCYRIAVDVASMSFDFGDSARLLCFLMSHGREQIFQYVFVKAKLASHHAVVEKLLRLALCWRESTCGQYFDILLESQHLRAHHVVLYFMSVCREPKFINEFRETCSSIALETIERCSWYYHTNTNLLFCWALYSGTSGFSRTSDLTHHFFRETRKRHLNLLQDLGLPIAAKVYAGGSVMHAMFDRSLRKDLARDQYVLAQRSVLWPFDEIKFQLLLDAGYDIFNPDNYELVRCLIIDFLASLREEMRTDPIVKRYCGAEPPLFNQFVHKVWKLSVHKALPLDLPPLLLPLTPDQTWKANF